MRARRSVAVRNDENAAASHHHASHKGPGTVNTHAGSKLSSATTAALRTNKTVVLKDAKEQAPPSKGALAVQPSNGPPRRALGDISQSTVSKVRPCIHDFSCMISCLTLPCVGVAQHQGRRKGRQVPRQGCQQGRPWPSRDLGWHRSCCHQRQICSYSQVWPQCSVDDLGNRSTFLRGTSCDRPQAQ